MNTFGKCGCGGKLVMRLNQKDIDRDDRLFIGCTRWPKCDFTMNINQWEEQVLNAYRRIGVLFGLPEHRIIDRAKQEIEDHIHEASRECMIVVRDSQWP